MKTLALAVLASSLACAVSAQAPVPPGTSKPGSCAWKPGSNGPSGDPLGTLKRAWTDACARAGVDDKCKSAKIMLLPLTTDALYKDFLKTTVAPRNAELTKELAKGKKLNPLRWKVKVVPPAQAFDEDELGAGIPASVMVTKELFEFACSEEQVKWVLAHELSHIIQGHGKQIDKKWTELFMGWWNQDAPKFRLAWFSKKQSDMFFADRAHFDAWAASNDPKVESVLNDPLIWSYAVADFLLTDPKDNPDYHAQAKANKEKLLAAIKATETEADQMAQSLVPAGVGTLKRMQDLMYAFEAATDPTHGLPSERIKAIAKK